MRFAFPLTALALLSLMPLHGAEPVEYRAARSVHLGYPAPEGQLF